MNYSSHSNPATLKSTIQQGVLLLQKWGEFKKLKFAPHKVKLLIFFKKRHPSTNIQISMYDQIIPASNVQTWNTQIAELKRRQISQISEYHKTTYRVI